MSNQSTVFQFKEGPDVFSPKDLIELGRPGTGSANPSGDLVLVPYGQFSFQDKQNKKTIYIASVDSTVKPHEIPLAKTGEAFWLTQSTVAHVVEGGDKALELYTIDVVYHAPALDEVGALTTEPPKLVGSFPTNSASNFRYSVEGRRLVFSDYVYSDGKLENVKEHDKAFEERGNTAMVYDQTYERHWDTWVGPKSSFLFSVRLWEDPAGDWHLGSDFVNIQEGTGHSSPVEPFGGTDDFDVSKNSVIYTTIAPETRNAWHTRQNIYVVDIAGGKQPQELTSGKQGATHNPILSPDATKAAWLELATDGYESDRATIVIYDLEKNVRYTLTQKWDRSPGELAFSKDGEFLILTAGDFGRIKVYVLPIPPTPPESTIDPELAPKYLSPVAITEDGAVSGLQTLPNGRLVFSKSSLTSPSDLFSVNLEDLLAEIRQNDSPAEFKGEIQQITRFTAEVLKEKKLGKGEEFWFKGAEDRDVHGWFIKPKGWKDDEKKRWPAVMLIHGGPQSAWEDQWSTRWNPNVFAQQGYFTVFINPTGSTSYGQNFTDGITGDWGGKPFVDLIAGWKYILEQHPEIDADRAVAAGASWGGYAINWIQGHPEYGFRFKALVCHDGVFDTTYNGFSTDELFFFNHDWNGR